jgi:hypothetical protein
LACGLLVSPICNRRSLGQDVKNKKPQGRTAVSVEAIKNNVKACMFDQYGTVVAAHAF